MKRLVALMALAWGFAKAIALAAGATTRVILTDADAPRRGFATLHYGELSETGAVFLGALVTLTPGTSTLAIDPDARALRLHLLDTADLDAILATLERDYLRPLHILFGERS